MDNLEIYNKVRAVPDNAKKTIQAGRLKGKTDINPMWRIKKLTEIFGPCGVGWKYEVVKKEILPGANDEIAAFVDINLYVYVDGKWSEAIPGTGGSSFVSKEKSGLYMSDECFKMALTDAISVSCKALGVGADVYWGEDKTKYEHPPKSEEKPKLTPQQYCLAMQKNKKVPDNELKDFIEEMFGKNSLDECTKDECTEVYEWLKTQ